MYQETVAGAFTLGIVARSQHAVLAARLVTALTLYQAEHGGPPETLDALVPDYLIALPDDPYTGRPFLYRISKGEEINQPGQPLRIATGQALLGVETDTRVYLVPVWPR
jgi:hypothetical protein